MEKHSLSKLVRRRLIVLFLILAIITCVISVVGIGYYYVTTHVDSNDWRNDEELHKCTPQNCKWVKNEEIQIFRKYLRYPTIVRSGHFEPCIEFLKNQAYDLNLTTSVFHPVNKKNPILLMTWQGAQPELPSILLNSHMDVVAVVEKYWTHPPFAAEIDEFGNIHGRGTQDMKSVGMLYLAAIRSLKRKGIEQLKRTIHLTYVADEESGGLLGWAEFVKSDDFKKLNVGFALDEGYPSSTDNLEVNYNEKQGVDIKVTAQGHSGHGSILFNKTAAEKLTYMINRFLDYRRIESRRWNEENVPYSNITVINLTILEGGIVTNVVAPEMSAFFNIRLSVAVDANDLKQLVRVWSIQAGENVTFTFAADVKGEPTRIDSSNPYWVAFKNATDQLQLKITPNVFQAATDSRYIRNVSIPALGFSPLMNTSPMLHEHNEYINADVYLKGIEIYDKIIESIANS